MNSIIKQDFNYHQVGLTTRGRFHKLFCTQRLSFAPVKNFSKVGRRAQIAGAGRKSVYEIVPRNFEISFKSQLLKRQFKVPS